MIFSLISGTILLDIPRNLSFVVVMISFGKSFFDITIHGSRPRVRLDEFPLLYLVSRTLCEIIALWQSCESQDQAAVCLVCKRFLTCHTYYQRYEVS
jgi:hypothetical protein